MKEYLYFPITLTYSYIEVLTSNICLNNYDQIRNYTIIKLESVLVYGPENCS
jgi:hypothetical protein